MNIAKNIKYDKDILHIFALEALVCSDWHVPGESQIWYHKLLNYLKNNLIKTVIIGGDFWNFDAISRWFIKDKSFTMSEEIDKGLDILYTLTREANVYLLCGNHDLRISHSLGGAMSFKEWMDSFSINNLTVTNYDYLYLHSKGEKYRICHPDMYSKIKGSQVTKIAQARQEHVMMGHQHFLSLSTEPTGKYLALDLGCMCKKDAFFYKTASTSALPEWENGFVHVKNGKIKLISKNTF